MIYFDNSATTSPSDACREAVVASLERFANPSSLHSFGFEAARELEACRTAIMSALGARTGKLIFTASGSEANNLAIFGSANAKERRTASRIITTDCEHPSVENALLRLEKQGFEIVKIPTRAGELDLVALNAALDKPVFMASMMLVNNETGAHFDVFSAFSAIKARYPEAICHCDAVQGFLKVKCTPTAIGADLITVSGHKIHATKGVGALWVSDKIIKAKKLVPIIYGGGQESGFRSGTENMPAVCGFAAAAKEGSAEFLADSEKMRNIRDYAIEKITAECPEISLNLPKKSAPHVLSVTLPSIKSETMLHFLSGKGIFVSSGSACSSHSAKTSSTLLAFGLSAKMADCTVRVSFCKYNELAQVDELVEALKEGLSTLVRIR